MINKLKLNLPKRKISLSNKNEDHNPFDKNNNRKGSHINKQLFSIEKTLKNYNASKPIKSQGRSGQKDKIFSIKLTELKNSHQFFKDSDPFELKNNLRKKIVTNRIYTEKTKNWQDQHDFYQKAQSARKDKKSSRQILIRPGLMRNKQSSPPQKVSQQSKQKGFENFQSNRAYSLSKQKLKLTQFQREQVNNYQQILFLGKRRVYDQKEFTDSEGDAIIKIGDSIAYRYQIISKLGNGAFGKVYKVYDHKKKQYIALKIIKSQPKYLQQAKIQVEILETAIINDPKLKCNLVRMKGSFIFRNHSCITFQLLHKNLYELLKQNSFSGFSLQLIRRFSIQILQCLLFLYNQQIVHCDLKPQNILLKQQNKSGIKVIDVGSGCFQAKQYYTYIQSRFYRAPEIILGIKYSPAIDMWSFGCILAQLYSGFPLFSGEHQNQQILMFIQLLGMPPQSILQKSQRRKKFFNENFELKISKDKVKNKFPKNVELKDLIGTDDVNFISFLQRCLEWDPLKRLTPKQALLHPWIIEGLPKTIRQEHIQQANAGIF